MIISFEKSEWVEMVEKMCDEYCKMPDICATQERLDRHCAVGRSKYVESRTYRV